MFTTKITSETRTNTNALLKRNSKVLQFLHAAAGYDFCKPYKVIKWGGNFTYKSLSKVISENIAHGEIEKFNISLIFTAGQPYRAYSEGYLDFAKVDIDSFDAVDVIPRGVYFSKINDFCRKSDFEETRKNKAAEVYIFIQHVEYIRFSDPFPRDFEARYRFTQYGSEQWRYSIKQIGQENKSQSTIRRREEIDKSGYCVEYMRRQLKYRAVELHNKREKEKADVYDTSEETEKLKARAWNIRTKAARVLLCTTDIRTLNNVSRKIERCLQRLEWATEDINNHITRSAEKAYNSPESADNCIRRANLRLDEAERALEEAENLVYTSDAEKEKEAV